MTSTAALDRLAASLKRGFVDHRIELSDGHVMLTLPPASRLVVEWMCGKGHFEPLDRQRRGVEVQLTLNLSEAAYLADCVERIYPPAGARTADLQTR